MPCKHKFQHHLQLSGIDFEPTTLIVGSFNPELPNNGNPAEWFYGRTANNYFWDVLPRLYGEPSLIDANADTWKQFCRTHKIALTDIISGIDDADTENAGNLKILSGFSDEAIAYHFDDFEFVDIVRLLQTHPTIKSIYLTRGITEAFWRHLWYPVSYYCNQHQIHERSLLTPTTQAAYQHDAYNKENPQAPIPLLNDYLLERWRSDWHF